MIFFIYWYLLLQARHIFFTQSFSQSFSFKNHRVMLKAFSLVNPNCFFFCLLFFFHEKEKWVVGTNGLEPSTSRLSGVRSNHLSYAPSSSLLVEMRRIELLTPCLQSRCSPSWATPPCSGFPRFFKLLFADTLSPWVSSKLNNAFFLLALPCWPKLWTFVRAP